MASSPDSRRRMRNVLLSLSDLARETRETAAPQSQVDALLDEISQESRPRAQPGSRFHRARHGRSSTWTTSTHGNIAIDAADSTRVPGFHEAGERLAQVNEDARNLLERPIRLQQLEELTREDGEGQHRRKRQRTRARSMTEEYPSINYGYYGQVVPGKLQMELVSTDGGIMEPYRQEHAPENLLKDDLSVYCTQSPRCNIVLRHQGGTTFSLEKLVIKAPKKGFTDPVREGLVFVAMKKDDVFDRTMRYRIYHLPTSRFATAISSRQSRQESPDEDPYGQPFDPQVMYTRPPAQLYTQTYSGATQSDNADAADCSDGSDAETEDPWEPSDPEFFRSRLPDSEADQDRPDNVTSRSTSLQNRISDWTRIWNERETGRRRHRPPIWAQRFRHRRFRSPSSGDYQDMLQQFDFDEVLRRGETASADRRSRRRAMQARSDQQIHQEDEASADREALQSIVQMNQQREAAAAAATAQAAAASPPLPPPPPPPLSETVDLLTPVVRFSMQPPTIEDDHYDHEHDPVEAEDTDDVASMHSSSASSNTRHDATTETHREPVQLGQAQIRTCTTTSSKMTIRFDPPLSGKYILLKLWSPRERGNIDIERVSAFGFAGVRWFPSVERR